MKRKRPGGQRQRLRRQIEELACESELASWLLSMWAWGSMSVQRCQTIAQLVVRDAERARENQLVLQDLEVLAQLGCSGMYANKMNADLCRKSSHISKLQEPYMADLHYVHPLGKQTQEFLLPHETFASIFNNYPETWKTVVAPSREALREFWTTADGHPTMVDSPLRDDIPDYRTRTVPILIHGDGVPITGIAKGWCKQATIFSWASMLTGAGTKEGQMFMWGAFDKLADSNTWNQFFLILYWSLQALYYGKWPAADHLGRIFPPSSWRGKMAGKGLAGGFTGFLFSLIGDLDYFYKTLQLPHFSWAKGPCALCRCTLVGLNTWTNMRRDAPWMATIWSKAAWFAWPHRSQNPLFDLPGQSCHTVSLDYMHVKYLGHDMYVFGAVLQILCLHVLPGTDKENVRTCWEFLKTFYKEQRIPCAYRYLNKTTMFLRAGRYPKLRGKAAEIRHMCRPMSALWRRYMNSHLLVHRQIDLMLRLNIEVEQILTDAGGAYALVPAEADRLEQATFSMMQLCVQIADHFIEAGEPLFDMTSKAHALVHCVLLARFVSPRLTWAFKGEDMMQKSQQLLKACVKGNNGAQAFRKMLGHYRLGLHLLWQKHLK